MDRAKTHQLKHFNRLNKRGSPKPAIFNGHWKPVPTQLLCPTISYGWIAKPPGCHAFSDSLHKLRVDLSVCEPGHTVWAAFFGAEIWISHIRMAW